MVYNLAKFAIFVNMAYKHPEKETCTNLSYLKRGFLPAFP